jgi:hypothetical protein
MSAEIKYGLQPIDAKLTRLLKPIFFGSKKEFLIINNLVKNWENIVGKKYARLCYPKSIVFNKVIKHNNNEQKSTYFNKKQAKLTIAVYNSSIGFLLENTSEFLIERIATLCGYKVIDKIIIKQEQKFVEEKEEKILSLKDEEKIKSKLKNIADQDLFEVLKKLGKDIIGKLPL